MSPETLAKARALALEEARKAALRDEVPVGAVIVRRETGEVVAVGSNNREARQSALGHAELVAIEAASQAVGSWRLEGCEMVVTLEPCPMCLGALQQARIESVVYLAPDPKGGALSLGYRLHEDVRTNHRFSVILEPMTEASEMLTRFFQGKRKK